MQNQKGQDMKVIEESATSSGIRVRPHGLMDLPGVIAALREAPGEQALLAVLTGAIGSLLDAPFCAAAVPQPDGSYETAVHPSAPEWSGLANDIVRLAASCVASDPAGTVLSDRSVALDLARLAPGGVHAFPLCARGGLDGALIVGLSNDAVLPSARRAEVRLLVEAACIGLEIQRLSGGEALVSAAMAHSPSPVVITDTGERIVYVNPAFERVTGYSACEALGQTPRLLSSGRQRPAFYRRMWQVLLSGRLWKSEVVNRRKNGQLYSAELSIAPVRNAAGRVTHFVGHHRDITREKELAHRLKRKLTESGGLSHELGDLVARVSHDLRSPIANVCTYTEILLEAPEGGTLSPRQRNGLKRIGANAQYTLELIADILDMTRIESGKLKLVTSRQDLRDLVQTCVDRSEFIASDRNIRMVTDLPEAGVEIVVDRGKIIQVLNNLISNALKYSPDGTTVTAGACRERDGVTLWVADEGPGIPPEELDRLFKKFSCTSVRPARGDKATGLGLFIVHEMVKAHGGTASVQTEPGRGARFIVTLPGVVAGDAG